MYITVVYFLKQRTFIKGTSQTPGNCSDEKPFLKMPAKYTHIWQLTKHFVSNFARNILALGKKCSYTSQGMYLLAIGL